MTSTAHEVLTHIHGSYGRCRSMQISRHEGPKRFVGPVAMESGALGRTYEDDGRRKGAGLRKEVPDAGGGDAGKHLHELGALRDNMFAG